MGLCNQECSSNKIVNTALINRQYIYSMLIIKKICQLLSSRQRSVAPLLLGAILLTSILETVSIGLIFPLVKFLNHPDAIYSYSEIVRIAGFIGLTESSNILICMFIFFIAIYCFKTVYFLGLTYFQQKYVASIMHYISAKLFKIYLRSPWTFHLQKNSAELQNNIINQTGSVCTGLISSVLNLLTETLVAFAIIIMLLYVAPIVTLLALTVVGLTSILFFYVIRGKLEHYGLITQRYNARMIKTVHEAFGSIKETKVLGREDYFVGKFGDDNLEYTKSWIYPSLIHQAQRSSVEILFIGGIVTVSLYVLIGSKEASYLISILALFAGAAFRLMPSVNRINNAIGTIRYYRPILNTIYNDMHTQPVVEMAPESNSRSITHHPVLLRKIELKDICFRYPQARHDVLRSVSLSIAKGFSVGFIGPSGAGKTTLVDIILGLLKPDAGMVMVDGCDIHENLYLWQKSLGYIPQNIYLSDNTIRRNVAFGLDDSQIDDSKVRSAIHQAQLYEVVDNLPDGLDTFIGEQGLRISGGQRQRIGIARALYNDPELLVMDEATSSLDSETEKEISNAIDRLSGDKTLLIIAHRMTTVERCDIKCYLRNGKIEKITEK